MRQAIVCLALLSFVAASPSCGGWDCADGYEPVPNSNHCRSILDAGSADSSADTAADVAMPADATDAATLASCFLGTNACGTGSTCIQGCPNAGSLTGVCSVPGRDTCGCGGVLDPCDTPGTVCLMPACCDSLGICVTPAERAAICARVESGHFDCAGASP